MSKYFDPKNHKSDHWGDRVLAWKIANKTAQAYSTFAYDSWPSVALALLNRGLSESECVAVMESKWMRWAVDQSPRPYGRVPAKAIINFLNGMKDEKEEIDYLVKNGWLR